MTTGKDWREHFESYSNEDIQAFVNHLEALFKDKMFEEIFGRDEGLLTLAAILRNIYWTRTGGILP